MQPRRSDIFPTVAKQSPISSKPSNSFVTAAAIKSPPLPMQSGEVTVARRLDKSFQANSTNQMRSKSAPRARPPPGPPPLIADETAKNVTFQVPQSSNIISPPNRIPLAGKSPENTATPEDSTISNKMLADAEERVDLAKQREAALQKIDDRIRARSGQ